MCLDTAPASMQKHNPLRIVDWRWRRATSLVTRNKRCSRRDDDAETIELTRFVRAERKCQTTRHREQLAKKWPNIVAAKAVWDGKTPQQGLLEAYLLTGCSNEQIAEVFGTDPKTVFWYERAFFHVREGLKASDWVANRVLRTNHMLPGHDFIPIMKALAYYGGMYVLEAFIDELADQFIPEFQAKKSLGDQTYVETRRKLLMHVLFNLMRSHSPMELSENVEAYLAAAEVDQSQRDVPPVINIEKSFFPIAKVLMKTLASQCSKSDAKHSEGPCTPETQSDLDSSTKQTKEKTDEKVPAR